MASTALRFGMVALATLALSLNTGCPPPEEDEDAGSSTDGGGGVDAGETDAGGDTDAATGDDAATGQDSGGGNNGTIEGQVTDALGNGVGDALVSAGGQETNADYQGNYSLGGVPAGDQTVTIAADWFEDDQAQATVSVGSSVTHDVQLTALAMQVLPADLTLSDTHNTAFDWTTETVAIDYVALPTRAEIDKALYFQNPALYSDTTGEATITPATLPDISGTATGFDFPIQAGSTYEGNQALDVSTIVDSLAGTPVTTAEADASVLWEPAIDIYLVNWDIAQALDLYYVSLAIEGQRWGGSGALPPQHLQHTFLHGGELWVELVFEDFIDLGSGITDSNGDGWRDLFAMVPSDYYSTTVYDKLNDDYITPTFDTLGLRDNLTLILDDLYTRTSPEITTTIGVPVDVTGLGTLQYPFVSLTHSNAVENILLVEPAP